MALLPKNYRGLIRIEIRICFLILVVKIEKHFIFEMIICKNTKEINKLS